MSRPAGARHRGTGPSAAILGVLARLSVVLLLGSGAFVWSSGEAAAPPPGGPFTLQDGDGKPVSDRDFRGKYMLVYFGYTFCPDACPTTLNAVADALDRLGAKADQIQAIFITVDPKRDTPAVMKQYVAAFTPRLIGLTGSLEQIAQVAEEYRVYHVENRTGPGPNDYSIDHSSVLYVMGPDGGFIAAFRGDQSGAEIADDLSELMP
ncbi:MAG TPA: SCO family protein [Acetobacteraceae bacterium]|nr:SCO family protein [Acetobacteraceae bacterium]